MTKSDFEQMVHNDLIAAGFDPDKYLPDDLAKAIYGMPQSCEAATESAYATYFCEQCGLGRFFWNLRKTSFGWICVGCLGRNTEWLSDPPDGWSVEEALNV